MVNSDQKSKNLINQSIRYFVETVNGIFERSSDIISTSEKMQKELRVLKKEKNSLLQIKSKSSSELTNEANWKSLVDVSQVIEKYQTERKVLA